jgi:SAM-dependent methyltransferase
LRAVGQAFFVPVVAWPPEVGIIAVLLLVLAVSVLAAAVLLSSLLSYMFGAPWVPTPKKTVRRMLEMAEVRRGEILYDLGSGDGRIVKEAARGFGASATGVEISPLWVLWGRLATLGRARIVWANLFSVDLTEADVVTLYLWQGTNDRLKAKLEKELKTGSRIVSHAFTFDGWTPEKTDEKLKIYLYRVGAANNPDRPAQV